jgi:hypothetical protein
MIGEIYVIRSPRAFDNPSKACRSGSQAATAGADGILHAKAFNAEMLPYMYLRASVLSITRSRSFSLVISGGRVVVKRGLPTCRWMWKAAVAQKLLPL